MMHYWDRAGVERLERLVSSLENQVVVNIGRMIGTAVQVQTVVKGEQLAFLEFLWIVAKGGPPIYNPMAIDHLAASRCLLMLKNPAYQHLIPHGTTKEEASNYKQLFTKGLVGLKEAEKALNDAISICCTVRGELKAEIKIYKGIIELKKAGTAVFTVGEPQHGFGIPHMLLKLDADTYHGRMKWAPDLIKDIKLNSEGLRRGISPWHLLFVS
jgi:hypothetical protein